LDYSKFNLPELFLKFKFFIDKQEKSISKRIDHKYLKEQFSIALNLHNIMEELYLRNPDLKNSIDFDFELEEIIKNQEINASKN